MLYFSTNFKHKIHYLSPMLYYSILVFSFTRTLATNECFQHLKNNAITGISWVEPVSLPLGKSCQSGLWQESAEFAMSNKGAESSALWEDCFLQHHFNIHLLLISVNECSHDGNVQKEMALQWCRQNMVRANSSKAAREEVYWAKLLC